MSDKLFNTPKNKTITAYDFAGNKYERNLADFKFRVSAYGVLIENNKILFKRHPSIDKFDLPGGGVEIDETIPVALIREFKEETGLDVELDKLLSVEDSFFTSGTEDAHGILVFYLVKKVGGELEVIDNESVEINFFDLDKLDINDIHKSCWNIVKHIFNKSKLFSNAKCS